MPQRAVYHVSGKRGAWKVTAEGSNQPVARTTTKDEAIRKARELAKAQELGQIKIHGSDGRIEREYTYGADPRSRG